MINQHHGGLLSNVPPVTKNLIIINALLWVATMVLPRVGVDLTAILGLHFFRSEAFNPVQLVTYMFMHDSSSITHLFFNMFAVYMFGRALEMTWGSRRYLIFYLITGIGAGIVQEITWLWTLRGLVTGTVEQVFLNGEMHISTMEYLNMFITVGASGAVFGILLAFGMYYPQAPLFIMFIPIPVKAKYVVIGYGLIELVAGIASFAGDSIAHFAHLGGMLFGFIMIMIWKKKEKSRNEIYF
jgi:membrane associated rhomboid family serine protease